MTTHKPAAERLPRRVLTLAAAALLFASLPLAAQERSRPSDSGDTGRTAYEVGSRTYEPANAPSAPSEPSAPAPSAPEPSASSAPEPSAELSPEPIRIAQERSRPSDSGDTGRTAHGVGSHSVPSSSAPSTPSTSSSEPPRTAQPTGSGGNEARRQPPSRGDRDHHGGRGHHGGSYYYPHGYYGPYGFWPFGWWSSWWWYDYPPYGYGQPRYYGQGDVGALDLDVYPDRTEVYIDGQYVGKVDAFDGWPRYLWLPKGTYDVVLYLDGFKTVARQISVYPGSVIDIDDRLEPGESVRPEDLASKTHERRDERLGYERERRERLERGEPGDDDDWRDRVRRERGHRRDGRDEGRDDDEDVDIAD